MTQYVALLRGVGPVSHARMPLKALAARCAERLGEVTSIGNTGNLVVASERPQHEVEAIVTAAVAGFGLDTDVFTRTRRQMQMLLGARPLADAAAARPDRLTVCFFRRAPTWPEAWRSYAGPERLLMFSNHLVVDYGGEIAASRLTIEKTSGARMTQRNWSSVLRIAARLGLDG